MKDFLLDRRAGSPYSCTEKNAHTTTMKICVCIFNHKISQEVRRKSDATPDKVVWIDQSVDQIERMDPDRVRAYLQISCAGLGFDIGELWWTSNKDGGSSSAIAAIGTLGRLRCLVVGTKKSSFWERALWGLGGSPNSRACLMKNYFFDRLGTKVNQLSQDR